MSRIGKKPIPVPSGVKVTTTGGAVTVAGPKQSLSLPVRDGVRVAFDEAARSVSVSVDPALKEDRQARAAWGSTWAHIRNMVEGVTKGYEQSMEVVGVGWTAAVQGKNLKLTVGFANSLIMPIPQNLDVTVEKQFVKIKGADKQAVGEFAAKMRTKRKPEPYNGKGIKYVEEVIKRKQGKTFGTTA